MALQQLLKAIAKGWKTILVITLLAVAISLYISITSIPQYRSQATFIIAPNRGFSQQPGYCQRVHSTGYIKYFSTYTDILISDRVYDEARKAGGLADSDLANYSRQTEMNPELIILILTIEGPDAQIAASLANEIGKYGIKIHKCLLFCIRN